MYSMCACSSFEWTPTRYWSHGKQLVLLLLAYTGPLTAVASEKFGLGSGVAIISYPSAHEEPYTEDIEPTKGRGLSQSVARGSRANVEF